MKCILLVLLTLVKSYMSAPIGNDADATILSYDFNLKEDGYSYTYTTSNGITRLENAVIMKDPKSKNDDDQIIRITGYYSYTDNDNNIYKVNYVADENGYQILRKEPSYPTPPLIKAYSGQGLSEAVYESGPQLQISSAALASLGGS